MEDEDQDVLQSMFEDEEEETQQQISSEMPTTSALANSESKQKTPPKDPSMARLGISKNDKAGTLIVQTNTHTYTATCTLRHTQQVHITYTHRV